MSDHITGEDLAAYVDGLLSGQKKDDLERHFSRCQACLEELAEIASIMNRRDRIPPPMVKLALGEKGKAARPVMPLRLVFEVAAVFLVVVFIGYLFLSGNRFWQTPEEKKPSEVAAEDVRPTGPEASARERERLPLTAPRPEQNAAKTKSMRGKNAEPLPAAPLAIEKLAEVAVDKGLPAEESESPSVPTPEPRFRASVEEQARPAATKQSLPKKELERSASTSAAVGGVSLDSAAGDQKKASEMKGRTVAAALAPFRIEGEAGLDDLRNPELVSTWKWLQKDMVLELHIDGSGAVSAVFWPGRVEPFVGRQADSDVKKLLFSVSEKKLRRARLIADRPAANE